MIRIQLTGTNKCVDLTGGSTAIGNQVELWDCFDIPNQTWDMGYMCVFFAFTLIIASNSAYLC